MRLLGLCLVILVGSLTGGFSDEVEIELDEHPDEWYHPDLLEDHNQLESRSTYDERTIDYWVKLGQETVDRNANRKPNENVAKNVIMFLGDGMSISTVAMARVYAGGEDVPLAFDRFPDIGMSKTYCINAQVADSACSATAYLTGVKGNDGTIGVNGQVPLFDCDAAMDESTHTHSMAKWAMDAGKDAGLVTTTRVTHASPAGVYAHIAMRDWEDDYYMVVDGCDPEKLEDIAEQLVHGDTGKRLKVILGGGRRNFLDRDILDVEYGSRGYRGDGKDLITEWLELQEEGETRSYVWNRTDLLSVDPKQTDRLLGLFEPSHCAYNLDRISRQMEEEPTLTEMVDKATDILSKNEKGFFLFVEGGRIDHGHHDNHAKYAVDETEQLSKAIEFARKKFSDEDTLIVVTSDHSHSVSFAGYPNRGNDIFGTAGSGGDGVPYMTISYGNGPGFSNHIDVEKGGRRDVRNMDTSPNNFRFPTTLPLSSETHGGEDVAVYASGPWSHLFTGTYEQNTIPHMMAFAACIGNGAKACDL
ncbi:alkaline phosphatase-like [Uranotaenia lowii]|uniref:alkaline phosphatase-like n=1 Tax=Uranotaenia lowii TaxID=190385 RepID=UPI00247B114F|nr:alkaline phosphatase-like [Uranotaenia lowii]